jgi:hypothetical protein
LAYSHRVSQVPHVGHQFKKGAVQWHSRLHTLFQVLVPYHSSAAGSVVQLPGQYPTHLTLLVGFALVPQDCFALGFPPLLQTLLPCGSNTFAGKAEIPMRHCGIRIAFGHVGPRPGCLVSVDHRCGSGWAGRASPGKQNQEIRPLLCEITGLPGGNILRPSGAKSSTSIFVALLAPGTRRDQGLRPQDIRVVGRGQCGCDGAIVRVVVAKDCEQQPCSASSRIES